MDFIKNNIEKATQQGGSGSSESGDAKASGDAKSGGQYDKYINQGVQYAEKNFLHSDTSAENIQARDKKVGDFISKEFDSYQKKQ